MTELLILLLGFLFCLFAQRVYTYLILKITPRLDWYTEKRKIYFWRFWK